MFKRLRAKIRRQKEIQVEVLETLCSICRYIQRDAHYSRMAQEIVWTMDSHFTRLKGYSTELRKELYEEGKNGTK